MLKYIQKLHLIQIVDNLLRDKVVLVLVLNLFHVHMGLMEQILEKVYEQDIIEPVLNPQNPKTPQI